jgi:hypothetical protein
MWRALRTTNENLNREFRRRAKTRASFSNEEAADGAGRHHPARSRGLSSLLADAIPL